MSAVACTNRGELDNATFTLSVQPLAVPADAWTYADVALRIPGGGQALFPPGTTFTLRSSGVADIRQFVPGSDGSYHAKIRSAVAGTQTLSVAVADNTRALQKTAQITFLPLDPGVPSGRTSWLSAEPNVVIADDGLAFTTLVAHIRDSDNAPIPGTAVPFNSTGTQNFFSSDSGVTDASGDVTTFLASTVSEDKFVTATTPTLSASTTVTFSAHGASRLFATLQANPNTVTADGVATTTLTFSVRDTVGMPLPFAPVSWASTGGHNLLVPALSTADGNGIATATLASSTAEKKAVTATSGALNLTAGVAFLPGPVSQPNCSFAAVPTQVAADNATPSTLAFTARDAFNNPVPNLPVVLTSTGSNNVLNPNGGVTDASGVFSATLTSSKAEPKTVTATSVSTVATAISPLLSRTPPAMLSLDRR